MCPSNADTTISSNLTNKQTNNQSTNFNINNKLQTIILKKRSKKQGKIQVSLHKLKNRSNNVTALGFLILMFNKYIWMATLS